MRYFIGRLAAGLGTLLLVCVLVFGAVHLMPGSYAEVVLGPYSSPAARAALTREFGLDRPLAVQFAQWLRHVLAGDLGTSLSTGERVSAQLARQLPVTAELALLSLLVVVVVGLPLALAAGLARGRVGRGVSRLVGASAMSTPEFVLGSVLVYLFSRYSLGLPVDGGYVSPAEDLGQNLAAMVLPALTLSVFGIALVVRTGRDAVAQVMSLPHVTAALARGEGLGHVVARHVLRNAAIPVLTVVATFTGYLMGGAVIVENLFSLPGLGQAVLTAINDRDYAVVQGMVLVAAAVFITINLLADFAYGLLDPRVRLGHQPRRMPGRLMTSLVTRLRSKTGEGERAHA